MASVLVAVAVSVAAAVVDAFVLAAALVPGLGLSAVVAAIALPHAKGNERRRVGLRGSLGAAAPLVYLLGRSDSSALAGGERGGRQ